MKKMEQIYQGVVIRKFFRSFFCFGGLVFFLDFCFHFLVWPCHAACRGDLSSPCRDWTQPSCSGSTESSPLNCQEIPIFSCFLCEFLWPQLVDGVIRLEKMMKECAFWFNDVSSIYVVVIYQIFSENHIKHYDWKLNIVKVKT